jgi:hypothetical protein
MIKLGLTYLVLDTRVLSLGVFSTIHKSPNRISLHYPYRDPASSKLTGSTPC